MIVRIMGEGQYDVPADALDGLNSIDGKLEAAVQAGDEGEFRSALADLLTRVREVGSPLPPDSLEPSEAILPDLDVSLDEMRDLLSEEGLIPG